MVDILHGTLKNCAFRLFARAVWYDAAEFVDALVNISSASTFDFFLRKMSMGRT
jgi:hypothetical protein